MMHTFQLPQYHSGNPVETYRNPVDVDEMERWCSSHRHIEFISTGPKGSNARRAKVNGRVKRWKRDRTRIAVPLKYGLHDYRTFTEHDIDLILIPVVE